MDFDGFCAYFSCSFVCLTYPPTKNRHVLPPLSTLPSQLLRVVLDRAQVLGHGMIQPGNRKIQAKNGGFHHRKPLSIVHLLATQFKPQHENGITWWHHQPTRCGLCKGHPVPLIFEAVVVVNLVTGRSICFTPNLTYGLFSRKEEWWPLPLQEPAVVPSHVEAKVLMAATRGPFPGLYKVRHVALENGQHHGHLAWRSMFLFSEVSRVDTSKG